VLHPKEVMGFIEDAKEVLFVLSAFQVTSSIRSASVRGRSESSPSSGSEKIS
jgi:hypothetical protein